MAIDRRMIQNFDWVLFGIALAIAALGIVNLVSATHTGASLLSDEVRRQLVAMSIGLVAGTICFAVDYRHFERLALPIFGFCAALLVLTLLVAADHRGNQSWLFGGRLQPAEFAKIGLILALARYFSRGGSGARHSPAELAQLTVLIGIPVGLIVLQRDHGVALLTLAIACSYLPFVRIPIFAWFAIAVTGVASLVSIWLFALAPYQRSRILDVVNPSRDPLGSGYQVLQSLIGIGSGGLFGNGYMQGTQTQLRFLPTQHTDFIFSVLAEEWGFVGAGVVLSLYALLFIWGLVVARNSKDAFGGFLAIGVVATLFWPLTINIAMVLGLAPVIGVPLPLFSYGGSAMVSTLIVLGLLMNVSMRRYVF
jgi:rod shape determining protein RodA